MAEFSKLVITNDGQVLLAKMIAGTGDVGFTKVCTSSTQYTLAQLEALSALTDIKQTSLVANIKRTNEVAVKIEAVYTNAELKTGYYMRTLGLYANDPDKGEILYAVTIETSGNCYMPPYNSVTVTSAYIQLITTVGNADNVSLNVSPGVYATIGDIQTLEEKIAQIYKDMKNSVTNDNLLYVGKELTEFTWDELSDIAKAGTTAEHDIHVGDYKTLTLSHTERDITTEYPIRMQVAGINTYAAFDFKSNYPKHHIDWISIELYPPNTYIWNESGNNDLVTSNMPCPMHNCMMRSYLGQIASGLPDGFKDLIVSKYMYMEEKYDEKDPSSLTSATGASANTIDWLWLPSEFEIFGTVAYGSMRWASIGQIQYPLFANGGQVNRIKAIVVEEGRLSNVPWWTMTLTEGTTTEVVCITENGAVNTANVLTKLNIPVCFRL